MFLAVFIICEAAAKPKMKDEPQNELPCELLSSEVEKLQDVPHLHNEEADKSQMNKMERKIQGKKAKPAYWHASIAYYPPCPKGQFHSNKIGADYSKCVKAFPLRN